MVCLLHKYQMPEKKEHMAFCATAPVQLIVRKESH